MDTVDVTITMPRSILCALDVSYLGSHANIVVVYYSYF